MNKQKSFNKPTGENNMRSFQIPKWMTQMVVVVIGLVLLIVLIRRYCAANAAGSVFCVALKIKKAAAAAFLHRGTD